ncbi:hypothetical protein DPMN_138478 [Dreissena polymorpha]|uniref:Uncharacterized protein n=1 Tax=Dreissena polymorpha TaxID=45954 RepID=A0A9D4G9U2_DREPO|nr:hypothetical protein DPMN_138478 [Dreissena polymorpha]
MQASKCLRQRCPVVSEIIRRFQYSLNTDVASSRLKFASVLYCCGHLHAAVIVLDDVERRYHNRVKPVCGKLEGQRDIHVFANMLSDNCDQGFSELPFALCVQFFRQEAYCAPYILLFEMNRGMTEDDVSQRDYVDKQWMDSAEVDARPLLYYLQYLTYGGLGERDKQCHAMRELESFICNPIHRRNLYHQKTAISLLGHCFEMEGNYRAALHWYSNFFCCCNANYWHVQRVRRLISSAYY